MKNKEQKILQDWINTLQGSEVSGIDSKTRLERLVSPPKIYGRLFLKINLKHF